MARISLAQLQYSGCVRLLCWWSSIFMNRFSKSHHWDPQHACALPLNHIRSSTLAAAKPSNPSANLPDGQTALRGFVPGDAMGAAADLWAGIRDRPHLLWTVTVLTPLQSLTECSSVWHRSHLALASTVSLSNSLTLKKLGHCIRRDFWESAVTANLDSDRKMHSDVKEEKYKIHISVHPCFSSLLLPFSHQTDRLYKNAGVFAVGTMMIE